MQMCKADELEYVRGLKIGQVFEHGGLERTIVGIVWREREHTWYVQWSRRGSSASSAIRLRSWIAWMTGAKKVFDMVEGPW
jgi:hypothetical protein